MTDVKTLCQPGSKTSFIPAPTQNRTLAPEGTAPANLLHQVLLYHYKPRGTLDVSVAISTRQQEEHFLVAQQKSCDWYTHSPSLAQG